MRVIRLESGQLKTPRFREGSKPRCRRVARPACRETGSRETYSFSIEREQWRTRLAALATSFPPERFVVTLDRAPGRVYIRGSSRPAKTLPAAD